MRFDRPIYETPENQTIEDGIAAKLERAWGVKLVKTVPLFSLDREIWHENEHIGWVEIKRRYIKREQYPDGVFLSMKKVTPARELHRATGRDCWFAVQFDDCLGYADMLPDRPTVIGGRFDRDDPLDVEEVALIKPGEFRIILSPHV